MQTDRKDKNIRVVRNRQVGRIVGSMIGYWQCSKQARKTKCVCLGFAEKNTKAATLLQQQRRLLTAKRTANLL
ncbi:hypothetical protein T4B_4359 [Trichinella pseudospiralis]|uniref:Uncharacterized protein n=1 Tax=Trichinella pseudospiralis TaxID=6337 RepID=A0A0V0Y0W2_TRIPS|nr:hypothetical protein T4E_9825 [Trichinella pseudospiralis]KRZ28128.1 hypothetical protein T4B_4359 [Trichinella pseudospiralis]